MKVRVSFYYNNSYYKFERELEEFDRNYDDEPYCYFLVDCNEFEDGGFEINIIKDAEINGYLTHNGYIDVYENWCDNAPKTTIKDCKITFVHKL